MREHAGYRLRLDPTVWVDVDAFARHLAASLWRREGGEGDGAVAVAALREALALYEDDLLTTVPDPWCVEEREALRRRYVEGALRLGGLLEEQGEAEAALEVYAGVAGREPLLEAAHRGAMRCYARLGRRDLALRQYRTCVEALARDLGVAPEPETEDLYRSIAGEAPVSPDRRPNRLGAASP